MRLNWIEIDDRSYRYATRDSFYFEARRRSSRLDRWDWRTFVEIDCTHCHGGMCYERHTIAKGMVEGREMMERLVVAFQKQVDVLVVMGQVTFKPIRQQL